MLHAADRFMRRMNLIFKYKRKKYGADLRKKSFQVLLKFRIGFLFSFLFSELKIFSRKKIFGYSRFTILVKVYFLLPTFWFKIKKFYATIFRR